MDIYERIKLIGSGNYGEVYLVRDKIKDAQFVIKRMRAADIIDNNQEGLENETKLLQKLRHINIVAFIDSFVDRDKALNIVMEYCDGGELHSKIHQKNAKPFSEGQIIDWFVQMALAIYYLHARKILHRDLKSQNIFIKKDIIKIGDFGISKALDSTKDLAKTCIGTPYYMSPELLNYKPYSYKSDIWSLGCIAYEMCNLHYAFDAKSFNALAMKIIKGNTQPVNTNISKPFRDLVGCMMKTNPKDRPNIYEILQTPIIKKRVCSYIIERIKSPLNNSDNAYSSYMESLNEQAELLGIIGLIQDQLGIGPQSLALDVHTEKEKNYLKEKKQKQKIELNVVKDEKKKLEEELLELKKIKEKKQELKGKVPTQTKGNNNRPPSKINKFRINKSNDSGLPQHSFETRSSKNDLKIDTKKSNSRVSTNFTEDLPKIRVQSGRRLSEDSPAQSKKSAHAADESSRISQKDFVLMKKNKRIKEDQERKRQEHAEHIKNLEEDRKFARDKKTAEQSLSSGGKAVFGQEVSGKFRLQEEYDMNEEPNDLDPVEEQEEEDEKDEENEQINKRINILKQTIDLKGKEITNIKTEKNKTMVALQKMGDLDSSYELEERDQIEDEKKESNEEFMIPLQNLMPYHGKIKERIRNLTQNCKAALGNTLYDKVYQLLNNDFASSRPEEIKGKILEIIGKERSAYSYLIEQIIFFQNTLKIF